MAEKKVEVEINGKILRVSEFILPDILKFGATLTKRTIKNPPPELLNMPKTIILPKKKEEVKEPEVQTVAEPEPQIVKEPEPKTIILPEKKTPKKKKNVRVKK